MRPVLHGDAVAAARALLPVSAPLRPELIKSLILRADLADSYRARSGRSHADWGDGSLESAASRGPMAAEPYLDELGYCKCLILVFEAILN